MKKLVALSMIVVCLGFFSFGCAPPAAEAPKKEPATTESAPDAPAPVDAAPAADPAEETK